MVPPGEKGLADKGWRSLEPVTFLARLKAPKVGHGKFDDVPNFTIPEHEHNRALAWQAEPLAVLETFRTRDRPCHSLVSHLLCRIVNIWMELAPMRMARAGWNLYSNI